MSSEFEGVLEADDRQAGEVFMLSFAAVGALALLDAEPAAASLSVDSRPLTPELAQALLRGAPPPPPANDLATPAPAASDAAFLAALAALGSPSDASSLTFVAPPSSDASGALAAPVIGLDGAYEHLGDDAIGSSTPPSVYGSDGEVSGDNLVIAMTPDSTLVLSGQNDVVLVSSNDVIDVLSGSSVAVRGGGAKVNLASHDNLALTGKGYVVNSNGEDNTVTVQSGSQATVYGDGVRTQLAAPTATATVIGDGDTVNAAASTVTVGSSSAPSGDLAKANTVNVQSGAVNLLDGSTLSAHGSGAVNLGSTDYVALFGTFDIYAPQATGASVIAAFGAGDVLYLQSSYSDIAALLGGVTETENAATLHLTAQDSLTLTGLDKSQLSHLAGAGAIRFH